MGDLIQMDGELSARLFEQVRSSEGLGRPAREHPQAADISTV